MVTPSIADKTLSTGHVINAQHADIEIDTWTNLSNFPKREPVASWWYMPTCWKARVQILGVTMDMHHWWDLMTVKLKSGAFRVCGWSDDPRIVREIWGPWISQPSTEYELCTNRSLYTGLDSARIRDYKTPHISNFPKRHSFPSASNINSLPLLSLNSTCLVIC